MKKILLSLLFISSVALGSTDLNKQLFEACREGNVAEVEGLIEQGADVNITNDEGSPLLFGAIAGAEYSESRVSEEYYSICPFIPIV